eukprot:scaffold87168_cov18-Tisochrysis_lutea.AAC.1
MDHENHSINQGVPYWMSSERSTGRMAFSYCWRYHCLPSEFSRSEFTATISGVREFNIPRMPGGIIYNTTLQGEGARASAGGQRASTRYTVPIGFDDLSAAVVMEIRPDQELPAQPPAPPGTICRVCALPLLKKMPTQNG